MRTLLLATVFLAAPALAEDDRPRLAFGHDAARTLSITWNTQGEVPPRARVRPERGEWREVEGRTERWEAMNRFVQSVELDGLEPEGRYEYQVQLAGGWSDARPFRTGPVDPCRSYRFVALGDDRSQDDFGPSLNWGPILQESLGENPVFALNGGDLVHDGDDATQWYNWLDHTGDQLAYVPHMPTIGNHDDDRIEGEGAHYNVLFTLPRNDVTNTEDYYYFTYGDLIVVSLSTTTFKGESFQEQADWLDRVLTENPKRWKIVFMHHPIYTSTLFSLMHPPDEEGQNGALVPVFDAHHVDLVIQSHNHWYQRFRPSFGGGDGENAEPVDDPADGTVYVTTGGAGAYTVDIGSFFGVLDIECAITAGCAVLRGEHHYLLFEMAANRLSATVKATAAQNFGMSPDHRAVIDAFVIDKAGEERIDCAAAPPVPDSAVAAPDATPARDASVPARDASVPAPDGSSPARDAAVAVRDAASAAGSDAEVAGAAEAGHRPPADDAEVGGSADATLDPPTRRETSDASPTGGERAAEDGCSCDATGGATGGAWLVLLLLPGRRRRTGRATAGRR